MVHPTRILKPGVTDCDAPEIAVVGAVQAARQRGLRRRQLLVCQVRVAVQRIPRRLARAQDCAAIAVPAPE